MRFQLLGLFEKPSIPQATPEFLTLRQTFIMHMRVLRKNDSEHCSKTLEAGLRLYFIKMMIIHKPFRRLGTYK